MNYYGDIMTKAKSIIGVLFAVALVLMCTGCVSAGFWDNSAGTNTGSTGATQASEAKHTEDNQVRLSTVSPPPSLSKSLERENLIKRLNFLNDENRIFYVYLLSNDGKVISYHTAQGKVSSVNSKLTTSEQLIKSPHDYGYDGRVDLGHVVESPALDGSYGTNGDGIFFFTMEGAYVEWNGKYMVSSMPMKITTPPELHMEI